MVWLSVRMPRFKVSLLAMVQLSWKKKAMSLLWMLPVVWRCLAK